MCKRLVFKQKLEDVVHLFDIFLLPLCFAKVYFFSLFCRFLLLVSWTSRSNIAKVQSALLKMSYSFFFFLCLLLCYSFILTSCRHKTEKST